VSVCKPCKPSYMCLVGQPLPHSGTGLLALNKVTKFYSNVGLYLWFSLSVCVLAKSTKKVQAFLGPIWLYIRLANMLLSQYIDLSFFDLTWLLLPSLPRPYSKHINPLHIINVVLFCKSTHEMKLMLLTTRKILWKE